MFHVLHPTPTRTTLGATWALVLDHLVTMVAFHANAGHPMLRLLDFACRRILRTILRIDRLAYRWQTGTLPKPRPASLVPPPAKRGEPEGGVSRPPQPRLPRAHMWLVRAVQRAAPFASQVEHTLAQPETRALHEAAPQLGRLLRPLCRQLGVAPPDWLKLPPRPRKPRPAPEPRPKRFRAQLPGMLPTDRPLPPRVVAAVRFYKKRGY